MQFQWTIRAATDAVYPLFVTSIFTVRPQIIQVNLTSENPQPIVAGQKLEARVCSFADLLPSFIHVCACLEWDVPRSVG